MSIPRPTNAQQLAQFIDNLPEHHIKPIVIEITNCPRGGVSKIELSTGTTRIKLTRGPETLIVAYDQAMRCYVGGDAALSALGTIHQGSLESALDHAMLAILSEMASAAI